jgi:predicted nucleotidyltransferase
MTQYEWKDVPPAIRGEMHALLEAFRAVISDGLVGVYLHGSLAMGCFNPKRSDLDILVVTRARMSVEVKCRLVQILLQLSGNPIPLEISSLTLQDLHPWRHPTPYDLHFSEMWRRRFDANLKDGAPYQWNDEHTDPDLAAHVTLLRERGLVLHGPPIADVFPPVPRHDYLASILADYDDARDNLAENPAYAILNMARVYRFLTDGTVVSKDEAGAWALSVLPKEALPAVRTALALYRGEAGSSFWSPEHLQAYVTVVDERVLSLREPE